jgi:hypothetical protein
MTWLLLAMTLGPAVFAHGFQSQCPESFELTGVWDLGSSNAPSRLVIQEDGRGYVRDQVEAMPFTYAFDLSKDPIWFDIVFQDTTMVRWETLVRCQTSSDGGVLKWVLRPEDGNRPRWPRDDIPTPAGVTVITLRRVELADSVP